MYYARRCPLPQTPKRSFFLWGPRQVGKTSLLKERYPQVPYYDLNQSLSWNRLSSRPELLGEEILAIKPKPALVIIDEVQRIPQLLNEVQSLIDHHKFIFGLCGSSARKLKRGSGNLLGGRALRFELHGLVSAEIGQEFNLDHALNYGGLPHLYLSDSIERDLQSYVGDYVHDEIAAEGLVRNLPIFSEFLRNAAISDGQIINFTKFGSECGASAKTAQEYFHILEDTLLGFFLPAYSRRLKRRVRQAPKFYFADIGLANYLARRGRIIAGSEMYGRAFESWILHELRSYREYSENFFDLSYYHELDSDSEVDLVVNDFEIVIEIKSTEHTNPQHLRSLRKLLREGPAPRRSIVVSRERAARTTEDGIEIMPLISFLNKLWQGEIIGKN